MAWPTTEAELEAEQERLARRADSALAWRSAPGEHVAPMAIGGAFFASPSGSEGGEGEPVWVAAVVMRGDRVEAESVVGGRAAASYRAGYLALREGPLLERAVRALGVPPEVLLVNAGGRDHPRRAGLALHLGAELDLPTVGVTDRPLLAAEVPPGPERGDAAALRLGDEVVGYSVRTRRDARPVCAHSAWRTDAETARDVVLQGASHARTPEPLRVARYLARVARARGEGRLPPGWRAGRGPVSPR